MIWLVSLCMYVVSILPILRSAEREWIYLCRITYMSDSVIDEYSRLPHKFKIYRSAGGDS